MRRKEEISTPCLDLFDNDLNVLPQPKKRNFEDFSFALMDKLQEMREIKRQKELDEREEAEKKNVSWANPSLQAVGKQMSRQAIVTGDVFSAITGNELPVKTANLLG